MIFNTEFLNSGNTFFKIVSDSIIIIVKIQMSHNQHANIITKTGRSKHLKIYSDRYITTIQTATDRFSLATLVKSFFYIL